MLSFFRNTLGPLFLIICCPAAVMLMWYTNTELQGSLLALWELISQRGLITVLWTIWRPHLLGSWQAWEIIGSFVVFQYFLTRYLPGKLFIGPVSPKGNRPHYKNNGILAYAITLFVFCFGGFYLKLFNPALIYDNFGDLLGALNSLSLVLCLLLYYKGRYWPSSTDAGVSGNFIFDYYWGTELYPRIAGINLKMFINCRLGMMSWSLILLSFAAKQQATAGLSTAMIVAVILQLLYITKFFIWETGYLASLDIMHDRAGYYICWGCLVWVPGIYTSPTLYLVNHPHSLSFLTTMSILLIGSAAIAVNYLADRQRQRVRASDGHCKVWGRAPRLLEAWYKTEQGEEKKSILLSSGWWGIARHFHYVPEIISAFCWSVPALFENFSPYFYTCFLTLLLLERAFRDDRRCSKKYGAYWENYCQQVPYRIIPFLL